MKKGFKNYLYNKEIQPPEEVWMNIEDALDKRKGSKKYPFYLIVSGILIISSLGGVLYWNSNIENEEQVNIDIPTESFNVKTQETESASKKGQFLSNEKIQSVERLKVLNKKENIQNNGDVKSHNIERTVKNYVSTNQPSNELKRILNDSKSSKSLNYNMVSESETLASERNAADDIVKDSLIAFERVLTTSNASSISQIPEDSTVVVVKDDEKINQNAKEDKQELDNLLAKSGKEIELKIKEEEKYNHWEVSSFIAPSYTRSLSSEDIWLIDLTEYSGRYQNSNNFGAHAAYRINPKWIIRSGVEINHLRQQGKNVAMTPQNLGGERESDIFTFANLSILNSEAMLDNAIDFSEIKRVDVNQHIQYLSFPLDFGYSFYNSKIIQLSVFLGTSTHLLRKNYITLTTDDFATQYGKATNLNKLIFGSQMGVQTRFKISPRLSFNFEPRFLYYLNTFNDNNKVKPYSINFNTGLLFGF